MREGESHSSPLPTGLVESIEPRDRYTRWPAPTRLLIEGPPVTREFFSTRNRSAPRTNGPVKGLSLRYFSAGTRVTFQTIELCFSMSCSSQTQASFTSFFFFVFIRLFGIRRKITDRCEKLLFVD